MEVPYEGEKVEREEEEDVLSFDVWDQVEDDEQSGVSSFEEDDESLDFDESSSDDGDDFEIVDADPMSSSAESSDDDVDKDEASVSVLLNDESVVQHAVMTSFRHPQCCDSLAMSGQSEDTIIAAHMRHAILYNLNTREILASAFIGFETYSIAQYGSLFVAGGNQDMAFFRIFNASTGMHFERLAHFKIGGLPHDSAMVNGLRFGLCGTEVRLLAANQDKFIYTFAIPSQFLATSRQENSGPGTSAQSGPPSASRKVKVDGRSLLCHTLRAGGAAASEGCIRQVNIVQDENGLDEAYQTDAIGPFTEPINCAAPSPNGKWIAVGGDSRFIYLLDYEHGYSMSRKAVIPCRESHDKKHLSASDSCQYVAWNSSSTLLAASSDAHHMVGVWSVSKPSKKHLDERASCSRPTVLDPIAEIHLILRVGGLGRVSRPCLALQFDPIDDKLLYFLERAGRVHTVDTRKGSEGWETLSIRPRLRQNCPQTLTTCTAGHHCAASCIVSGCSEYAPWLHSARQWPASGKLTGLVATSRHGVLVACRDRILQYGVLRQWSVGNHRHFPQKFKAAVILLLAASRCTPDALSSIQQAGTPGLRSLPQEVLFSIIQRAAHPVSSWI